MTDLGSDGLPFLQGNAEFGNAHPSAKYRCDSAPKRAQAGDVLISVRAPVGQLNIADRSYGIGRGLAAVRARHQSLWPRYLWWALCASVPDLQAVGVGSTYDAVSAGDVGAIRVLAYPMEHQRAIADYLDQQASRIDAMVAAKRRMTELLRERLQAAIDHHVCDNTSERQPLGKVLGLLIDRRGITPGKLGGGFITDGVPVASARNVQDGQLDSSEDVRFVSEAMALRWMREPLKPGDVIVTTEAPMGAVALVRPENLPVCLGQRLIALRPQSTILSSEYLFWALQTREAQDQLVLMSTGSTAVGVRQRYLVTLRLPIPALELQGVIAAKLDAEGTRVSVLLRKLHRQNDLLLERCQALIKAAVTGEMTIPGVAA